jgi:hypothetical protein
VFVDEVLPTMVEKTLDLHVFPNHTSITTISRSFDLWMFKGSVNIFALVINFLNGSWTPMHVIVGLFEVNETNGQSMGIQLESLLSKFGLVHRVITFEKDEGSNLTTLASALHSIIDCLPLKFLKVFGGTCFGHMMFKACQYATNDDKVSKGLVEVIVKDAHAAL